MDRSRNANECLWGDGELHKYSNQEKIFVVKVKSINGNITISKRISKTNRLSYTDVVRTKQSYNHLTYLPCPVFK